MRHCCHCGGGGVELRPYGPGGAYVCFGCAFETPERGAQTEAAFVVLVDAAAAVSPAGAVVIGDEDGPSPFTGDRP